MTDRPDIKTNQQLTPDLLQSNWDCIAAHAGQIADEVDINSDGISGNFRKQVFAISQFFRESCDYQRALEMPCVLAIANPLAQAVDNKALSPSDIANAVQAGLCTIARHGSNHRTLFRIFLHPILLTYFVLLGFLFASYFVVGPFEEMYAEFGIALPGLTNLFIGLARLFRTYTISILMLAFGLPPLLWLLNWVGHEKRETGMSRLDVLLARKRPTVARWLLHVSLLLEAGLSKDESVERAARLSGKRWLKQKCDAWLRRDAKAETADKPLFDRQDFRVADKALAAPRSKGQVALLQQVATWYRDSSSSIIEWIAQLLIPLYVLLVLIGSALLIISLFMPIFAILGGLTGGKVGGVM